MSEILKGVFAAAMSVLKADLSLDIEETLNHAKKILIAMELVPHFLVAQVVDN